MIPPSPPGSAGWDDNDLAAFRHAQAQTDRAAMVFVFVALAILYLGIGVLIGLAIA